MRVTIYVRASELAGLLKTKDDDRTKVTFVSYMFEAKAAFLINNITWDTWAILTPIRILRVNDTSLCKIDLDSVLGVTYHVHSTYHEHSIC